MVMVTGVSSGSDPITTLSRSSNRAYRTPLLTSFFSRTRPVTGMFTPSPLPPSYKIPVTAPKQKQKKTNKVLAYTTAKRKEIAEKKRTALEKAKSELQRGVHNSLNSAAKANSTAEVKIAKSTLRDYIRAPPGKAFRANRGKTSKHLTPDQEQEVVTFMRTRAELGSGLNFRQAS